MATATERRLVVEEEMPKRGFARNRMAAALGLSRARLYQLLDGDTVPWALVERWAAVMGVAPEFLATRRQQDGLPAERDLGDWVRA